MPPTATSTAIPTALITGANTGIGRVTAITLAQRGYRVFLAGLSLQRTQPVIDAIAALRGAPTAQWLPLDLADLQSVRECADAFLALSLPLHLLINNAGLAGNKGRTRQGFELAFGVNHLGHFLLTTLLLDRLRASAPARVVTVSSRAHYRSTGLDWAALQQPSATWSGIKEYSDSKLANALFSAELARRLQGTQISTYALHPGVVATDVWRHVSWPLRQIIKLRGLITAEEGALTTLHCATSADVAHRTGLYWDRCKPKTPSALAQDTALAQRLWAWSENAVQPYVP